jgi:HD superfamily phosphohydrolase
MPGITIRDPLWDTIHIDAVARRIIDTGAFQRLRYIKQLGHAHLVYPGASHTRFDHAVGVYHLARRALAVLRERGELDHVDDAECRVVPYAALLHDVGHYPFSHALEELEPHRLPGDHEEVSSRFLAQREIADALLPLGDDAPRRIGALIRGRSTNPLQGLVSGSLDLDKIEYLKRDAHFCGVPYGDVDVDRLLHGLTLVRDPGTGRLEIGVHEKGVAALESLLFAKYQMFRNVYWHHAVRAATVLYKRVVSHALDGALITADELVGETDEGLMHLLASRARARNDVAATHVAEGVAALRARRLPKRVAEVAAAEVSDERAAEWLEQDSALKRRVEDMLSQELGVPRGSVYLDFPEKPAMFGLHLLLRRRSGELIRLGPSGHSGVIGLPRIADELYRSARVLRMYVQGRRMSVDPAALAALAAAEPRTLAARFEAGERLLTAT